MATAGGLGVDILVTPFCDSMILCNKKNQPNNSVVFSFLSEETFSHKARNHSIPLGPCNRLV